MKAISHGKGQRGAPSFFTLFPIAAGTGVPFPRRENVIVWVSDERAA